MLYNFSPKVLVSMPEAAQFLFRELAKKLKTCNPHCVEVLKASISLILYAVARLKAFSLSDEKYQKGEVTTGVFVKLKDLLWDWIVDCQVIGGSVFGGTPPAKSSSSWKAKEELKVIAI